LINSAQFTAPGSSTITSKAPVTVVGSFTVMVNVYNSAGEVIKSIKVQNLTTPVNNISLSASNTITTLQGAGSTIDIIFDGVVIGTWDGTNNNGKPVTNGQYKIQVDNVGSGVVTSVSQNATVNRTLADVQANVYNGAGELVRTLYSLVSDAMSSSLSDVALSTSVFQPGTTASSSVSIKSATNELQVFIETSGTPVTLLWDGTNNGGTIVTPGEYTLEIHWNNGSGQTEDISRTLLVVAATGLTGKVIAKPNELGPNTTTITTFDAGTVTGAAGLKVRIYTVSGELVKTVSSGTTQVQWDSFGVASGIYLASVEVDGANGGVVSRQILKLLVVH
jgi:flagellar hook assembly protein FlgD